MQEPDTDLVYEKLKNLYLVKKKNIILTGIGGSGKSYIIRRIVEDARKDFLNIHATASTGVAAVNINGSTVHRFFGMGLAKGNIEQVINYVKKNNNAIKRIRECNYLIIDEVSMISNVLFDKIDNICKYFRQNKLPFGGIYLLVSGDFLQLPPVEDNWCFESPSWKELGFIPYLLTEPKRFTDKDFCLMLSRARENRLTTNDIIKLKSRVKAYEDYLKNPPPEIKPTILHSHKIDVEFMNKNELNKLPGDPFVYKSQDGYILKNAKYKMNTDYYKPLLDSTLPDILHLKKDAQIMLIYNLDVDIGLCNGSRGVITDISDEHITVKFKIGIELIMDPILISIEDENAIVTRKQYPLCLAYSSTIHKSQGSTLDYCIIDLGPNIFAAGQAYVALSRARNWDSVLISSFAPTAFKVDKKALAYYKELEETFEMSDL